MYVFHMGTWCLERSGGSIRLGWITDSCEPPRRWWELNPNPLGEEPWRSCALNHGSISPAPLVNPFYKKSLPCQVTPLCWWVSLCGAKLVLIPHMVVSPFTWPRAAGSVPWGSRTIWWFQAHIVSLLMFISTFLLPSSSRLKDTNVFSISFLFLLETGPK